MRLPLRHTRVIISQAFHGEMCMESLGTRLLYSYLTCIKVMHTQSCVDWRLGELMVA